MLAAALYSNVTISSTDPKGIIFGAVIAIIMVAAVIWGLNSRKNLKKTDPITGYVMAVRNDLDIPGVGIGGSSSIGSNVKVAIEYRDPKTGESLISQQRTTLSQIRKHLPAEASARPRIYFDGLSTPLDAARSIEAVVGAVGEAKRLRDQGVEASEIARRFMNSREANLTGFSMLPTPVPVKVWVRSSQSNNYVVFEWID